MEKTTIGAQQYCAPKESLTDLGFLMTLQPVEDGTLFPAPEASLGSGNIDPTGARKSPSFTFIVVESINGSNAEAGEALYSLATDPLIIVTNESAAGTDRTTRFRWHKCYLCANH
ncbi:hypothetical protein [Lacipirellula sp.]|uniref:hypothetical protein n=1 Tax=Lacipirellula sp. TaxID=2691419 RepID=UPI003D09F8E9